MTKDDLHIDPIELLSKVLANEASAEEKASVEEWRALSDDNRKEFEAFSKLWNTTASVSVSDEINIDSEWNRMDGYIQNTKVKTIGFKQIIRIAAAVIFLISATVLGIRQSQLVNYTSTNTALNNINLPDGSVVSLNSDSKISYNKGFGSKHRNITLKGEGYFEVAKNKELPFTVSANEAQIQVVGTRFNIKAYKNSPNVKVTVTEGKVLLTEKNTQQKNTYLSAGETGTFDKSDKTIDKKETVNINDVSWKTRVIEFNNTPLSEVADVLSNNYPATIKVSKQISNCSITVNFDNADLASILKVLKSTLNLSIKKEGDTILISGTECVQ